MGRPRIHAPPFIRIAVGLWKLGSTVVEIADAMGVSKGTISGIIWRNREQFPARR